MKHEIGIVQPEYLTEDWPEKYKVFSWLEYVVTVPNPIFLITTRKANGAPNANLHSWGLLTGERGNYSSLLALLDQTHTYANILREGEWCINFPSFEHYPQCFETVYCNAPDNDEITEAGFTLEPARTVQAPRIAECLVNLECRLEWHRPLYEDSRWQVLVGRVLHVAVAETAMAPNPVERMKAMGLMYNVRSTVNPLDGQQYGPNTLELLNKVVKPSTDEGSQRGGASRFKEAVMNTSVEILTVDATNVAEQGFFCYKSKPKSVGYQKKMDWLDRRFAEGLRIKILHEGDRSVGFVEYIPGEYAWRAVNAEGYMVIHCMWVVGRGKGKGYGSRLLKECVEDARKAGKRGVAMVSSSQPWLAGKELFVKNGFEVVGQAPPTFELLVKQLRSGPPPAFPDDWDERLGRYGPGLTVAYADQCPYIEDAVKGALELAGERGVKGQTVRLESSQQVRDSAPSAYGIFNIVYDGKLASHKYISSKTEREAFLELLGGA